MYVIGRVLLMAKTTQYTYNTLPCYPKNTLGSITYILKLGRVFHSPTKTYKQSNTLLEVFNKHHGLNYFGLDYQKGIANG